MPIVIGGGIGAGTVPAPAARTLALGVVVNDFGAVAGGPDCSPAFEAAQEALDAKLAAYPGAVGTLYWLGDPRPYLITRPMDLQRSYTEVSSLDGPAEIWASGGGSCVLLGIRRTEAIYGGTLRLLAARSTLAVDYPAGGLTLTLAPGTGAAFGDPITIPAVIARPMRVLLDDGAGHRCVLGVANRTGDVLALQDDGTGLPVHYDDGRGVDGVPDFRQPDRAFPAGSSVSHEHRPDLYGELDASACPTPGARRGVRLWGDTSLYFQGQAFALGRPEADGSTPDHWGTVSTFTLEMLVKAADGGPWRANPGPICNLGNGGNFRPFGVIGSATNRFVLNFATADGAVHQVAGSLPPTASGPLGICFQFTLGATKSAQVYVRNPDGTGVQVAADLGADAAFWASTTPTTLARNDYNGLLFARQYNEFRAPCQDNGWISQDFTLCGFLISAGRRYTDRGVGLAQQRIDGGTVDDNYRYFNGSPAFSDPEVVCYVAMSDPATTNRLVTAVGRESRRSFGYLLQGAMCTMLGGQIGNALRGLTLRGSGTMPTVQLGAFLECVIEDCDIDGGTQAVACMNLLASYPLTLRNLRVGGLASPLYIAWSLAIANELTIATNGRCPIRVWASNLTVRDVQVINFGSASTAAIVHCHAGGYGGSYEFRAGIVDAEGTSLADAAFVIESITGIPATTCIIESWYMGTMGSAPLVRASMRDGGAGTRIALDVGMIQMDTAGPALDYDGGEIVGAFHDVYGARGGPSRASGGYTGPCNVTFTRVVP